MPDLRDDIKSGSFRPVYLLCGEEKFLLQSWKKMLRDAITGGDTMNYNYFEGDKTDVEEVISLADTMPFFGERRLILLEDTGFFKTAQERLAEYFPQIPETTVLVFAESAVDKRNRLYKWVKEHGLIADAERQESKDLASWGARILKNAGKKITSSDMNEFLERTGTDMGTIRNELDKLIAYTGERSVVTAEDIRAITTVTLNDRIFELTGAMASGDVDLTLEIYADLLALRTPPAAILSQITRQFNQMMAAKEAGSASAAAKALHVSEWIAKKILRQAGSYTAGELRRMLEASINMEEDFKSGRIGDRMAVELLVTGGFRESGGK